MMNIRELDQSKDMEKLLECVVEIQDFERVLVPSMPKGADICLEYTNDMLQKCKSYAGTIYVAVVDEKVVGYTSIYTRMVSDEIDDGSEAYGLIGDLVILESHRGRGFGKQLIERAQQAARDSGVKTLRIAMLSKNTVAADLYGSLGFKPFSMQLEKSL